MPRYRRLFLPEFPVHIVQRGHDRQPVFIEKRDYEYYLANLIEVKAKYEVQLHAFCLMTNHVHLLISPGPAAEKVSAFMRVLAGRQTRFINKRQGRTGTLWESRFKASLVDTAVYLLACYRYIELNPVRAGMVEKPHGYEWSSYRHNSGETRVHWIDEHAEFSALGPDPARRAACYRAFVEEGDNSKECETIRTSLRRNQVTGDDRFREQLSARTGRELSKAAPGRPWPVTK
jgi:putative transposase